MKYKIYFTFVKKDGTIVLDEEEQEKYYKEEIIADDKVKALDKFFKQFEGFEIQPAIMDIEEEQI